MAPFPPCLQTLHSVTIQFLCALVSLGETQEPCPIKML